MTAPARGFTDLEFAGRVAKIQAAMALHDVGALLLTGEAEIRYVTGFMTQFWQSPTRPWFVVVPAESKPIAIIPSIGASLMRNCISAICAAGRRRRPKMTVSAFGQHN